MKNTWLSHFLKMAMGSLTRQEALTGFNNVTINFNYDRAVEFFLFSKLQTDFDLTPDEACQAISSLTVIRPYGTVGSLPFQLVREPFRSQRILGWIMKGSFRSRPISAPTPN